MFLYKNFLFNIFYSFNPNHAYWNQRRLFSGNLPGMLSYYHSVPFSMSSSELPLLYSVLFGGQCEAYVWHKAKLCNDGVWSLNGFSSLLVLFWTDLFVKFTSFELNLCSIWTFSRWDTFVFLLSVLQSSLVSKFVLQEQCVFNFIKCKSCGSDSVW